jgi:hypothetical protein
LLRSGEHYISVCILLDLGTRGHDWSGSRTLSSDRVRARELNWLVRTDILSDLRKGKTESMKPGKLAAQALVDYLLLPTH